MVEYKFHLYTGGWFLGVDPITQYALWHSKSYYAPIGWAVNYNGWCDTEADQHLENVMFGNSMPGILSSFKNWTYLHNKYVGSIPLWSAASSQGYDNDWSGVVNHVGYGIVYGSYPWTILNVEKSGDNTVNVGFKSDPEDLNIITSEWFWDAMVLNFIYDPLVARNPYNLAEKVGILVDSWSVGTYDGGKKVITMDLKSGVKFHDGTTLTAEDVKWSTDFQKACGPGVAWAISSLRNIANVTVVTPGEGGVVKFFMTTDSAWAEQDAVFQFVINPRVWKAIAQGTGANYNEVTQTFDDRMLIRDANPHEYDYYDYTTQDYGTDGLPDLATDGTGGCVFLDPGPDPPLSQTIDLVAFRAGIPETPWQTSNFHMTQSEVSDYLNQKFHEVGNVNYPGSVNEVAYNSGGFGTDRSIDIGTDLLLIARAIGTSGPPNVGIGNGQYNEDADITLDDSVTGADLAIAGFSLLSTAG
jgi:hypothetical protein